MRHELKVLSVLSLIIAAGPVPAGSLSIGANLSQAITGTSSFGDTSDEGYGLRSSTDLGVNFRGTYPTTLFALSVGARLSGNTENDRAFFSDPNPRIVGSFTHTAPRLTTNGSLSVVPQFASDRQFEFFEVVDDTTGDVIDVDRRIRDEDVLQLSINARLGAQLQLDTVNSLSASVAASAREYPESSDTLDPTRSLRASVGWSRALDRQTSGGLSLGVRFFTSEADNSEDAVSTTVSANLSRSFTPRHSGNFSLGVSFTDVEDELTPNLVGGANFSYRPTADIALSAGANQRVAQNDDGALRLVSRLNGGASWTINSVSSLNLGTGLSLETPVLSDGDDDTLTLRLTAGYSLRLTESWSFRLSYGIAIDTERDNPASDQLEGSNRVFMRISRNFDILP
jgi:hypothetical protein